MGLNHSPKIVTDSLVLCLDAGNKKSYSGSGNTWIDLSSSKLTAYLANNVTFTQNALSLNGVDQYAYLGFPAVLNLITEESTTAWIYPTDLSSGRRARFGNRFGGFLATAGTSFGFESNNGTDWNNNTYTSAGALEVNKWQEISFTFKGNDRVDLYKNGKYVTGKAVTGNNSTATHQFVIGTETFGGYGTPAYFSGYVAVVNVYSRKLTAEEIQQNFNALRGRFGV